MIEKPFRDEHPDREIRKGFLLKMCAYLIVDV